jgi:NTP pyrophosphatase (non-canonical NTP hydrolase)
MTPIAEPDRTLHDLMLEIRAFAQARDWERFHTPKNLAMAIAGEAGELAAEYQWLTEAESIATADPSDPRRAAIESEMADVLIYLVRLADVMGVDLVDAASAKIAHNAERFRLER